MVCAFIQECKKPDWLLFGAVLFLSFLGILNLQSLALSNAEFKTLLIKQVLFVGLGFGVALGISTFDYRVLRTRSALIFLLWLCAVAVLVLPIVFGIRVRGAASWISFLGVSLQPIEFIKIVLLIVLAKYFAGRTQELVRPRHLIASGFYVAVPSLIAILQPDLGAAVLFAAVWFAVVALLGLPVRRIVALFLLFCVIAGAFWIGGLEPYQRERIASFFSPEPHALGAGYQVKQALIAIGSGGLWGRGTQGALHARLGMLPESATDFSFAALVEQIGFLGGASILVAFAIIIFRILRIGFVATNNFSRAYAVGLATLLFAEMTINIGMNVGFLPVTGLPLPFVSYGGSHTIATLLGIGLLESIRRHQPQMLISRGIFEHSAEDFSEALPMHVAV